VRRRRLTLLLPAVLLLAVVVVDTSGGSGSGPRASERPVAAKLPRKPPVVMLLLDEFPIDSLLTPDGKLDAVRYPNFATLAGMSTWFRNATTIYDSTPKAIPAIMDGRTPSLHEAPDTRDHPHSVFTALGRRGYRIVDSEEATSICPRRYCPHAPRRRPAIIPHLVRGRPQRLHAWIRSIRPARRPTLWLKHALLPHQPWIYLPDGKQVRPSVKDPVPGEASPPGFGDRGLTNQNELHQLLQTAYVDREIGRLLRRLRDTGMLGNTLLVVLADHGYAWEVGVKDRRRVTRSNVDEIAPIPLFVKAPGQRRGRVSRNYTRTIDVVPTVADILGIALGYRADGRSAFGRAARRRRIVRMPSRDFSRIIRIGARSLERRRRANIRRRTRLFGVGSRSVLLYGNPYASLFRIGPHRDLMGRRLSDFRVGGPGRVRARMANAGLTRRVTLASTVIPTQITGRIRGAKHGAHRDVLVAVNGVLQAAGRTFYVRGSRREWFSMLVPETALHAGRNDVRVLQVTGGGRSVRLMLLARN
jgi:Sulfatase